MSTYIAIFIALLFTPFGQLLLAFIALAAIIDRSNKRQEKKEAPTNRRVITPHYGALSSLPTISERRIK